MFAKLGLFPDGFSFGLVTTQIELLVSPFSSGVYVWNVMCEPWPSSPMVHDDAWLDTIPPDSYFLFLFELSLVRFRIVFLPSQDCLLHVWKPFWLMIAPPPCSGLAVRFSRSSNSSTGTNLRSTQTAPSAKATPQVFLLGSSTNFPLTAPLHQAILGKGSTLGARVLAQRPYAQIWKFPSFF